MFLLELLQYNMPRIKLIVTGTGRCGTVYMAKVLTSLGLPCGHESIFNFENEETVMARFNGEIEPTISDCSINKEKWIDESIIVADSSYMAAPHLSRSELNGIPVIHVVRHPMKVISSFVKTLKYFSGGKPLGGHHWQSWIYKKMPELIENRSPIEKACLYYVLWNNLIEDSCKNKRYFFHKIEYPLSAKFYKFIGVKFKNDFKLPPSNTNAFEPRDSDFTLSDIPKGPIFDVFQDMASKYKYNLNRSSLKSEVLFL